MESPSTHNRPPPPSAAKRLRRDAIRLGAAAAVLSAILAVLANLSEIAGWFRPDETRVIVEEARGAIQHTDAKVEELLTLLRNQAAATGLNLDIESEEAIKNAIRAIVASGNAQKQAALEKLDAGDVHGAAELMRAVAANQAAAVSQTSDAAAESWRETGALYYSLDLDQAIGSYTAADQLQPGNPQTLAMLGHALSRAGRADEAAAAFQRCLASTPSAEQQASAHLGLGNLSKQRGHYVEAEAEFRRAEEIAAAARLLPQQAMALLARAAIAREQGATEAAAEHLQEALDMAGATQDEVLTAKVLAASGVLAAAEEDWSKAQADTGQALAIYRARNDLGGQAHTIGNLGAIALLNDDLDGANELLLESVDIGERLGWQSSIAIDLINLAAIAARKEDFALAEAHLERAEDLVHRHDLGELGPIITFNRGEMAEQRGDLATACSYWAEALPALEAMGSVHVEAARRKMTAAECTAARGS